MGDTTDSKHFSGSTRRRPAALLVCVAVLIGLFVSAGVPGGTAFAALPDPPPGLIAVGGCDTGDTASGNPPTPTVYVDPAWLATVADGSVITLHGNTAEASRLNFFDVATNTWTGLPIVATPIDVPQCVGVKSGATISNPHWSFCVQHNLPVCTTSVYTEVSSLPVNPQVGNVVPTFTNDTTPLSTERYAQINWLAMHASTATGNERQWLAFAIWCISNQIPDGSAPGFQAYNGAYVPTTTGQKTTWDHCPVDISFTKTTTNVFTNDANDRTLSPAWLRLAAGGNGADPGNNNWASVSLDAARQGAPDIAVTGVPTVPAGTPIPFEVTLSTDQVNLVVPAGQTATICADDTSGAVIQGRFLYFPTAATTNTARVCLNGQAANTTATLGLDVSYLKPSQPVLSSGNPACQGLIQLLEKTASATTAIVPGDGNLVIHKQDGSDPAISLAGATFEIRDGSGALVTTVTTGTDGSTTSISLPAGNYTAVETVAPEGYVLDPTPHPFVIVADQTNTTIVENTSTPPGEGAIRLRKVDADRPDTPLSGATFELRDSTDAVVATVTTGDDGMAIFSDVPLGSYTLVETVAPQGYRLDSTPRPVTLGSTDGFDLTATNSPLTTVPPTPPATAGGSLSGTGGAIPLIVLTAGVLLVAAGVTVYLLSRRRRRDDSTQP